MFRSSPLSLPSVTLRHTVQISSVPAQRTVPLYGGASLPVCYCQSAQGRGVCAGTVEVLRSSPCISYTHVATALRECTFLVVAVMRGRLERVSCGETGVVGGLGSWEMGEGVATEAIGEVTITPRRTLV